MFVKVAMMAEKWCGNHLVSESDSFTIMIMVMDKAVEGVMFAGSVRKRSIRAVM